MNLDVKRTAIVAVHFQKDIVAPSGAFGGFFAEEVKRRNVIGVAKSLLEAARSAGVPVVFTRVAYKADYSDLVTNSPLLGMVTQFKCLVEGSESAQIVPELSPKDGDRVVTHQRVGGFAGSELDVVLRSRGIDTLVFLGVATNASVEGTARQSSDLGYRTIVVADGCSTVSEAAHEASIASLGLLAEITTSADLAAAFTSSAT